MRWLEASLRRATPKGHETFISRTAPHQGLVPTSGPPCVQDTLRHPQVPPIFSAILREANSPEDIVTIAMQMRESPSAREYRDWIQSSYGANRGLKAVEAQRELDALKKRLRLELGLEEKLVGIGLWKFTYNAKLPRWLFKSFYVGSRRRYQFIRDIAKLSLDVMRQESELIRIFTGAKQQGPCF
jgi:hypothetical protein